ncbi:SseB family protein [Microbacterium sp.]|uniref:SseB family protein n=1 Tax=Microbacterium sp. TaxID=51671 RepID=UPI002E2F37D6|nr:SseB family protein [Microbacterium sp.]HEX5727889.1 SseB family protein [Microbacterium sp.]
MALFSKRKNSDGTDAEGDAPEPAGSTAGDAADPGSASASVGSSDAGGEADGSAEAAASVGISVTSYRGLGAEATPPGAAPAESGEASRTRTLPPAGRPPEAEAVPGLRDNVVLREALAALPSPATPSDILGVARQLLQGHLYLRVKGDARTLLAAGEDLPIGVVTLNGNQYVLAYSGATALRTSIKADTDIGTSAMAQPVRAVIRYVLSGSYAGLILDHASAPARAVIPRELLQKLSDQADPTFELKTLLSDARSDATASSVAEALTRAKFWVAVNKAADGQLGVAEARTDDGARLLEIFSHPLEVASSLRGDRAAPMTAAQLAGALRNDEGIQGVLVDPGGPWIRLSRNDLAPVLALTD